MRKIKKVQNIKNIMIEYIRINSKEYILVTLIFIIGLFIGVMFVNNCSESKQIAITNYISDFTENFKNNSNIDKTLLLSNSIKGNFILAVILWFAGTTIIGMPVVLGIILFRGFCLGYTVSAVTFYLGTWKGILFCICALFLHNVVFIPALLTTGVSSIKFYKSIINDRRKENIKIGITKHTIICLIMLVVLVLASFIESEISIGLLRTGIKFM